MIVEKVIKVKFTDTDKNILRERVAQFTEGGLCEGIDCGGIICSPECPLWNLDEEAQKLRRKVLDLTNGAD